MNMKSHWILAAAILGTALAFGCNKSEQPPKQEAKVAPPKPTATVKPEVPPYELKNDELAALKQYQDLMRFRRYEQARMVASQYQQTPGFQPLAKIAEEQSKTPPPAKNVTTPGGLVIDLGRFEQLRPMAVALRDPKVPEQVVASLLSDPDSNTKLLGIGLLMVRQDAGAADAIRPLVNHQDYMVRAASAFALSALRDPAAEPAMQALTGQSAPDPLINKAAQFVLEHLEMETRPNRSAADKEAALMRSNQLFRELMNDYELNKEKYRPQIEAMGRQLMQQQQNSNELNLKPQEIRRLGAPPQR
jgi:HEAT repeat protein